MSNLQKSGLVLIFLFSIHSLGLECPTNTKLEESVPNGNFGGALMLSCKDNLGKLNGPYETRYSSGQVRSKGFYKDGKIEGVINYYYKTGEKSGEANLKNDELDGIYEEFFKNGKTKNLANYKNNKLVGEIKEFTLEGKEGKLNSELSKVVKYVQTQDWKGMKKTLSKIDSKKLIYRDLVQLATYNLLLAIQLKDQKKQFKYSEELFELEPEIDEKNNLPSMAAFTLCMNSSELIEKKKISLAREACVQLYEDSKKPNSEMKVSGIPMLIYTMFAHLQDYKGAFDYCSRWLKKFPNDPELNKCVGIAATGLKDYQLADKHYSLAQKNSKQDDQLDFLYYLNLGFIGKRKEGEAGLKTLCEKGVENVCECIKRKSCFAAADQETKESGKCLTCDEYKKNFDRPVSECVSGPVTDLSSEVAKSIDSNKVFNHMANCFIQTGIDKFDGEVTTNFILKSQGVASGPFLLVVDGVTSSDLKLTNCIGQYFVQDVRFSSNKVKCNAPMSYNVKLSFTKNK